MHLLIDTGSVLRSWKKLKVEKLVLVVSTKQSGSVEVNEEERAKTWRKMNRRRWPFVTLEPHKMCEACAVVRVREKCVCVQLGGHNVCTTRRTHGCCYWLSAKPSLGSFCRRTIYKKTTLDDCQNGLFSKSSKFLMKPLRPVAWCLNELICAFQFCPIFTNYQPNYRLANCAGSMNPNSESEMVSPTSWARGPSKRRGWWLIC